MMSLEKSLRLLAPVDEDTTKSSEPTKKEQKKPKLVSPVKIPAMSEDEEELDLSSLLRSENEEKNKEDNSQSKESEKEDNEESEKESEKEDNEESEKEDNEESEVDNDDSEESEEDNDDSEESEEDNDDSEESEEEKPKSPVLKINRTVNKNLTPSRFTLEIPKSPEKKFFEKPKTKSLSSIKKKLKSLRYTIMKFIFNQENSYIDYIICYDPNGELVFIHLDDAELKLFDEDKLIKISYSDEEPEFETSFIESIKNKITPDIYGVVFYNGRDYCIVMHDEENLSSEYYTTSESSDRKIYSIPNAYAILNYDDIITEPLESIKTTKVTYSIIQNEQVNNSKSVIKNMMETAREYTVSLQNFDSVYKRSTQNIIDDWSTLSEYSSDYYYKYSRESLTDNDKKSFDQVSINMFLRFQTFNENVEKIDRLSNTVDSLNKIINEINKITSELEEKDEKLTNQVIEMKDIGNYI